MFFYLIPMVQEAEMNINVLYNKGRYSESEICHEGVEWINMFDDRNNWRVLII